MAMLKNEMKLLKSVAIQVDDNHVMIVAYQYHTEKNDQGKRDRSKSLYRYLAKVQTKEWWNNYIEELFDDNKRLETYVLPEDDLKFNFCVNESTDNYAIASWLQTKVKKAMAWDKGMNVLKGWKDKKNPCPDGYSSKDAYLTAGYSTKDGNKLDITDQEALLKNVGKMLFKNKI